jgi:hypothetical protein
MEAKNTANKSKIIPKTLKKAANERKFKIRKNCFLIKISCQKKLFGSLKPKSNQEEEET